MAGLLSLTIAGAALRLYGIGHQGLWFDEAYTVMLVKLPLGRMLSTIPKTESTPYLYYLLEWGFTHLFGHGATAMRLPSAVFGTLTVPVAYLAAASLLESRRAGLAVAALTAFNPLLIWYSQEARAYELLVLTSALSLAAFARASKLPTSRRLALWSLASGLALCSHYEAALVVVPEALWLLALHRRQPGPWVATAVVAACGGALLPLLIAQINTTNSSWIGMSLLDQRLAQILPQFVVGTGSQEYTPLMWAGFALCLAALLLLARRAGPTQRNRALAAGALALAGFGLVLLVDALGTDTVITRNLLGLWLPAAILLGGGLGAPRAGAAGVAVTAGLCVVGLAATVSVATDASLQRPDWAGVARALGPWPGSQAQRGTERLIVVQQNVWLESLTNVYMRRTSFLGRGKPRRVTEIDIVANTSPPGGNDHWLCWWGAACNLEPSRLRERYAIPGFHPVSRTHVAQFTILRLASNHPRRVYQGQIKLAVRRRLPASLSFYGLLIQRS